MFFENKYFVFTSLVVRLSALKDGFREADKMNSFKGKLFVGPIKKRLSEQRCVLEVDGRSGRGIKRIMQVLRVYF